MTNIDVKSLQKTLNDKLKAYPCQVHISEICENPSFWTLHCVYRNRAVLSWPIHYFDFEKLSGETLSQKIEAKTEHFIENAMEQINQFKELERYIPSLETREFEWLPSILESDTGSYNAYICDVLKTEKTRMTARIFYVSSSFLVFDLTILQSSDLNKHRSLYKYPASLWHTDALVSFSIRLEDKTEEEVRTNLIGHFGEILSFLDRFISELYTSLLVFRKDKRGHGFRLLPEEIEE
jgi:hypothetical protein